MQHIHNHNAPLIKTSETRCLEIFKIHLDEMDGQASAWECDSPRVRALPPTEFVLFTVNLQFFSFIQSNNPD